METKQIKMKKMYCEIRCIGNPMRKYPSGIIRSCELIGSLTIRKDGKKMSRKKTWSIQFDLLCLN